MELINAGDFGTQRIEALVDVLVAAVDLLDVVDDGCTVGRHGCDQEGYPCANVWRGHFDATEGVLAIQPDHCSAVRVTEDDLCAHVDQFVYKEQAGFKHFLVYEHGSLRLSSGHQDDGQEVRREARPDLICYRKDGTIDKGFDFVVLLCWNKDIISSKLELDAHASEGVRDDAQAVDLAIFDGDFRLGHGGHPDKGADLDHVW